MSICTTSPPVIERPAPLEPLSVLLVTQNVGSIECSGCKAGVTDEVVEMTKGWIKTFSHFLNAQARQNGANIIDVLVVNLQEIGGKKHNAHFNKFLATQVRQLYPEAGWCSGLLMAAEDDDVLFTAMGTVIFLSPRAVPVSSLLSVRHRTYVAVADDPTTYTGNSNYLFHGAKFSNAEKSRKGYLLASLRVGYTVMNFLNLHLFHDADNAVAISESPSKYVGKREEAFLEAMQEVLPVVQPDDPLFIFGDFNTRLDGLRLIRHLKASFSVDVEMGKKEIVAPPPVWDFLNNPRNQQKLLEFDIEAQRLMDIVERETKSLLGEFPVRFMPTYLFEDTGAMTADGEPDVASLNSRRYKKERLPAWCDRVWFNSSALSVIAKGPVPRGTPMARAVAEATTSMYTYDSASMHAMDHKAVFLHFQLV